MLPSSNDIVDVSGKGMKEAVDEINKSCYNDDHSTNERVSFAD